MQPITSCYVASRFLDIKSQQSNSDYANCLISRRYRKGNQVKTYILPPTAPTQHTTQRQITSKRKGPNLV